MCDNRLVAAMAFTFPHSRRCLRVTLPPPAPCRLPRSGRLVTAMQLQEEGALMIQNKRPTGAQPGVNAHNPGKRSCAATERLKIAAAVMWVLANAEEEGCPFPISAGCRCACLLLQTRCQCWSCPFCLPCTLSTTSCGRYPPGTTASPQMTQHSQREAPAIWGQGSHALHPACFCAAMLLLGWAAAAAQYGALRPSMLLSAAAEMPRKLLQRQPPAADFPPPLMLLPFLLLPFMLLQLMLPCCTHPQAESVAGPHTHAHVPSTGGTGCRLV